jgi:hypothetical protein
MTLSLVVCGGLAMTPAVQAQPANATVNWGLGPQTISGDSDVSTLGTLVDAFALGNSGIPSTTVNGVTFAPFVFPDFSFSNPNTVTSGNYNFTEDEFAEGNGFLVNYSGLGTDSGAYHSLSDGYQFLLGNGGGSTAPTTLALTISGLTAGQTYLFQWWDNNSSLDSSFTGLELNTVSTAGNAAALAGNDGTAGSVGQFAIGTFMATSANEEIDFNGSSADGNSSDPMLNAFQLRVAGVPEPSTCALLGIGALALVLTWRPRRAF